MQQISLNLTLTDEQYKQLMESSLDEILKGPATRKAIKEIITSRISEYLTLNPKIIEKCFKTYNSYGWETGIAQSTEQIVKDAAKNCSDRIQKAVEDYMMDTIKSQDADKYIMQIISAAVLQGVVSSMDSWRHHMEQMTYTSDSNIRSLASRLGLDETIC